MNGSGLLRAENGDSRLKILAALSWPAILEQIFSTLISYVDTAMVGVMGASATAAISINAPVIWLLNGVMSGVGVGYSVQVANAVGAEDTQRAKTTIRQGVLAMLAFGIAGLVLLQLLSGYIPVWLGADDALRGDAGLYLRIYTTSLPFVAAIAIFSSILRCMGDSKCPLIFNTAANVLNLILNFFLIYETRPVTWGAASFTIPGAGMGVAGAALGSTISIAVAGVLTLVAVFDRRRPIHIRLDEAFAPDRETIRAAARLGLPYIAERATINFGQLIMISIVTKLGTVALAANHITITAEGLCYLPAYGISFAATALVGQAVGAKNSADAKAYGTLAGILGFVLSVFCAVGLFVFAHPLAGLFNSDQEAVALAAQMLRIVAVCEPLFAVCIVLSGALRGAHDVRFPMVLALVCMWGVRVACMPILVFWFDMGLAGVWISMVLDLSLRGIACTVRWQRGRWMALSGLTQVTSA